jgi:hypothetical protein
VNHILLERRFEPCLTPQDFVQIALDAADCLPLYRVEWRESLLSADGSGLLCRFEAPDAESVRQVARDDRTVARVAWVASVHDTGREGAANVVVSRQFDQPTTVEAVQAIEEAGAWCLEQRQVTFLRTFFSADGKRMLCLYRAPDAESVREAQREAGMPVERVWACRNFTPENLGAA